VTEGGELTVPLNVSREALIETLQANLDAEKQKREEAQAAITKRREAAEEAISSLSADELLNLVQKYVNDSLDDIVEMVADAKATGRLKSADMKPGPKESSLEKFVRVLSMASDPNIEVQVADSIYSLL
jgi:CHAD domain-containing protein